jgi:2-polyprenyl-3-methyl-5-hydroxy-6-metoxy-1,4-benzoquinol methylase
MVREMDKNGSTTSIQCPICGTKQIQLRFIAKDWRFFTVGQEFQIIQCKACNVAFTWPRFSREEQDSHYPQDFYTKRGLKYRIYNLVQDVIFEHRAKVAEELLNRKDIEILDVGCGRGAFLSYVSRRGWHTCGVEPSSASFDYIDDRESASDAQILNIHKGFLEDAQFPDKSFDVVTLWHVIEHSDAPLQLLQESRRILKKDGLLMIALPNFDSLEARIFGKYWLHLDVPRHLFHFSVMSIQQLIKQAGFHIEEQRSSILEFPLSVWHSTVRVLWIKLGWEYRSPTFMKNLVMLIAFLPAMLVTFLLCGYSLFFPGEVIELYCREI